jgi:hypothetical protein
MNPQIKELQEYLKTSPLGISYSGSTDGYINQDLKTSSTNLQNIIVDKLNKSSDKELIEKAKTFTIISGDNIISSPQEIKDIISKIEKGSQDQKIKSIQEMINNNPFGISYGGPKDGIINADLIKALKDVETNISTLTGAQVGGKIVSGDNIVTDTGELTKTFELIDSFKKSLPK